MSPNTAPLGIVLVHGWLGAPGDLAPLAQRLIEQYGAAAVDNLCLPGHGGDAQPPFNADECLATLAAAIDRRRGQRLVLIGHSTGGSLLLAEISRRLARLDDLLLLVLCATPPRIDLGYTQRWGAHTSERTLALHDLGALVGLVNRLARRAPLAACRTLVVDSENRPRRAHFLPDLPPHSHSMGQEAGEKGAVAVGLQPTIPKSDRLLAIPAPALIVQGEADELVPASTAGSWDERLATPRRHVHIAGAGHHLFKGAGAPLAIDTISRAIDDARRRAAIPAALRELEPGLAAFAAAWPDSPRHLAASPAGTRALDHPFTPTAIAECEPTLANIEITTRCTLGCASCARTQLKLQSRFMSRETFLRVLDALPHAWRINLVGLGEPLLHPQVIEFIQLAVARNRRVGLVTNAMNLDADLARALCASGLGSLTFSIDAVDPETAERVRKNSDMALISKNIHGFIEESSRQGVALGSAVFTALTGETLGEFEPIIDFAADHGIDALMVTDLNFPSNQARSVRAAYTPEQGRQIRQALKRAVARRLPVLSVWGLEEFALSVRHPDYLLLRGEQLAHRSSRHRHCLSPWQTIPVNVDGRLTICDCQPGAGIGNILKTPLTEWWNGPAMREQRRQMLSDSPPEACRVCPRF